MILTPGSSRTLQRHILALPCIRQMNRVNSRSDFHDDSTINIVGVLLLLLLL